jgi:hypothetical protein
MNPTNNLRFVMRVISSYQTEEGVTVGRNVQILQQLWESPTKIDVITGKPYAEWRDVPTEEA